MKHLVILGSALILGACASANLQVRQPDASVRPNYTKELSRPKDQVWNDAVAALGQRFFVINNLDKSSGFINISYSGDPARYVDCGAFTVTITGPNAKTQTIDGAAVDARYETVAPMPPYGVPTRVQVRRQISLEGRVNLIFEATGPDKTRVTTATRYVLTRKISMSNMVGQHTDTASFNGNEKGQFPQLGTNQATECVATGELEKSVLSVIR